tara:strand:- start:163 stop:1176 length:1014 start_codon:yes stop_codon:yes gene_type:complete
MQYLPHLAAAGLEVRVESLFDANYLEQMYAGRRSFGTLSKSLLRRMRQVREQADVVWLEKEALPWFPWIVEHLFWPRNIPVVTDYDDAIFHRYDQSRYRVIRSLLGQKIDNVMRASTVVVAGNRYLAHRAANAGANRVEIVPTVVDMEQYHRGFAQRKDERVRVGWIGTPETWASFAKEFSSWIEQVAKQEGVIFRVVGAEILPRRDGPFEFLPWTEESEISLIQGMDIGLMPLPDTPWTRGKCGYKLIQYMACSLPVIASPVGVNRDIVEHGVNGFLAKSEDEWRASLQALIRDPELRLRMGQAGRKNVEQTYSLQTQGPRMARLLRSVAENNAIA